MPRYTTFVLLMALVLGGCGGDPDHELKRAKLALNNNKPDQALRLASSVLEARPDDPDAMLVRATAQMRLLNFKGSYRNISKLLEQRPNNYAAHQLMATWCFAKAYHLLKQSNFATDTQLHAEFDELVQIADAQARWLLAQSGREAEGHFTTARILLRDADRLNVMLGAARQDLSNLDPEGDPIETEGSVIDNLKKSIAQRKREARDHLETSLEKDPKQLDAALEYAALLGNEKDWDKVWTLANHLAGLKELPEALAAQIVMALLQIPNNVHPWQERVELGWKIQENVKKDRQKKAAWRLTSARLHLQAGEFAKAQPLLESAMKTDPGDLNIPYLLAQALVGQRQFERAREVIEQIINKAAYSPQIQAIYGAILNELGEKTMAKSALRRASELDPDNAAIRQAFLNTVAQDSGLEAVGPQIDKQYNDNPQDPQAIRTKIQFEQARGGRDEILKVLRDVQFIQPLTDEHLAILVGGYDHLKEYDKVERFARQLVSSKPEVLATHLTLASALLAQRKDAEAKQILDRVPDLFPQTKDIDELLAQLYLQRQRFDRAHRLLEKVVEQEPGNLGARLMLAQAQASLSMHEDALEQINQVLLVAPDDMRAHSLAATVYQMQGDQAKADSHLAQVDQSKVNERVAPALKAQLLVREGKLEEAAQVCQRAINAGRDDPALRRLLAGIAIKNKEFHLAESHLLAMVRTRPDDPQGYSLLTRFYASQPDLIPKGLDELSRLQTVNEALSRLAQASLLASVGERDRAMRVVEPMLDPLIARKDRTALAVAEAIARIHVANDDLAAASEPFDRLIQAGFLPLEARVRFIDFTAQGKKADQVIAELDDVVRQLSPEDGHVRLQVLRRYAQLRRGDRVLSLLSQWIQERPESWRLHQLKAQTLSQLGRADEAVDVLREAIELSPDNLSLRLQLAGAETASFNNPGAEATLQEAAEMDQDARFTCLAALGQLFVQLGLNLRATEVFDELESLGKSTSSRVTYAMGQALWSLDRKARAAERLAQVPDSTQEYVPAQVLLARIEQAQFKLEDARARLETLAEDTRFTAAAAGELLGLNVQSEQAAELLGWFDAKLAVETLPDEQKAGWLRARVWMDASARKWEAVLKSLKRLVELDPDSAPLQGARIAVWMRLGRVEDARLSMLKSDALRGQPLGALLAAALDVPLERPQAPSPLDEFLGAMAKGDRAAAESALGRLSPFRTVFRDDLQALLSMPENQTTTDAFKDLIVAVTALRTGIPQLAKEICDRVAKANPSLSATYSLMVDASFRLNESLQPLHETLRAQMPDRSITLFVAARTKYADAEYESGIRDLRALLAREPDNVHIQYELTAFLQAANQVDEAIEVLEELWNGQSGYRYTAGNNLSYILAEQRRDRLDEAYAIANECFQATPQMLALRDTIGWIEHLRGNHEIALKHLSIAMQSPRLRQLPETHYHLGLVYRALGNDAWARYHLEEAAASDKDQGEAQKATKALVEMKRG